MNRDSSSLETMGDLLFDVDLERHTAQRWQHHGVGLYEREGRGQTQENF